MELVIDLVVNRMKLSLRSKLSLSYIVLALIGVFLISIIANVFLESQFRNYVIQNQEKKNKEIVSLISHQYNGNGVWNINGVQNIGINYLEQGLIIKLKDLSGKTVWDATLYNSGLCNQMLSHISQNMFSRYPNWKGKYIENKYVIMKDFKQIGIIEIGYFGPFYFTDEDLIFINALNKIIGGVGFLSLLFALLFGTIMAKRISVPISRVIDTAQSISNGSYDERIEEKSNINEINQLTSTINSLAENLEKQELLRKRLTQDVAHELRTPLATLQSHMEAMIDGIWKPDIDRLKSCHDEIMRISRMVGDLEKLSKYESENLILNKTEFDISELIKTIIMNFENVYKSKGIEIIFKGKKSMVYADRDKISQAIINLMSNALKYTPSGGVVEVTIKSTEKAIMIGIKDSGIGISKEDLPYIFERFYRADKSRNRLTGGAGIGLTIAKAIVEAHKGKITVESELNSGTEFTIYFPKNIAL
jgi:two-component system sensor histidine kinase BaeS